MLLNLIFGALPEVIYFSLFLIYTKDLKTNRLKLFLTMFVQYCILKLFIQYNVWFQILYTILVYCLLKMIYKEKTIITDVFVFALSSLFLILISILSYVPIMHLFNNYILAYIINRILLFFTLYLLRGELHKWYLKFNSLWNRKPNAKVRSLTVRNVSVIIFNLMFYVINLGMLFAQFIIKK